MKIKITIILLWVISVLQFVPFTYALAMLLFYPTDNGFLTGVAYFFAFFTFFPPVVTVCLIVGIINMKDAARILTIIWFSLITLLLLFTLFYVPFADYTPITLGPITIYGLTLILLQVAAIIFLFQKDFSQRLKDNRPLPSSLQK